MSADKGSGPIPLSTMDFDESPIMGGRRPAFSTPSGGPAAAVADTAGGPLCLAWRVLYPLCICLFNFALVTAAWLWLKRPIHLYRLTRWVRARLLAGVRFRTVRLDAAVYRLAEFGRPDPGRSSLLLLHSVADDCTAWVGFLRRADPRLDHAVALDLPGHGGSLVAPGEDFDPGPAAARLRAVLCAAGLADQPVHAVGYSAGALLALAYAAAWPDQTCLLTLAAPLLPPVRRTPRRESSAGVADIAEYYNNDAEFDTDLYNWLLPWDPDLLASAMRHRAYRRVGGSERMRRAALEDRLPRLAFHRALLANLTEEPNRSVLLHDLAARVRAPTQIIWGLQDEISPVSGSELLKRRLPNVVQTDLLDECGHSVELECPDVLYNQVYKFRKNQSLKKCD